MDITGITFSQEQQDAWNARLAMYNASHAGDPLMLEEFIKQVIIGDETTRLVRQMYDAAVARIGQLANSLPYAERLALIAQIEESIDQ